MLEVIGKKERRVIPVRLETPEGRIPQGGAVPVAVHEKDWAGGVGGSVNCNQENKKSAQKEAVSELKKKPFLGPSFARGLVFSHRFHFIHRSHVSFSF
jgi:hypothetical protein